MSVDPDLADTDQPYAYAGDDPVNESDPSGDGVAKTHVVDRCVYFVCMALAGIVGTTYVYWIDVYELNGEIDGEANVEAPTVMQIVYDKDFTHPIQSDFIPDPYEGMHVEYYINLAAGTYTGVIQFFEGVDGQGPNPTVTVKGKRFLGTPPPAPFDPRPIDYLGHGPGGDQAQESTMVGSQVGNSVYGCNRSELLPGIIQ